MKYKVILVSLITVVSLQAWEKNGIPVCEAESGQSDIEAVALSGGRVAISWLDTRSDTYKIYLQVIDSTGAPIFQKDGIRVSQREGGEFNHNIATDGLDIFVVYEGGPPRASDSLDIFLNIIDGSTGERKGGDIKVCGAEGQQYTPRLCVDLSGGAWVCWRDYRSGEADIYLAKISPEGEKEWEAPVCSLDNERGRPNLVLPKNGIFIFWAEKRNDTLGIFGNRVVEDSFQWGRDGKLLLSYFYGFGFLISPDLPSQYTMTDQAGGAYIFPAHYGVERIQRVDSLGNLLFDSIPPVAIPYSITSTKDYGVVGCYPLSGGPGVLYQHVKIVKIDSSGARPWGPSFRVWTSPVMDTTWYHDPYCSVVGDYHGGCVVAIGGWQSKEERDIIVVHVDSSGDIGEPIIVCDASDDQQNPVIVQNPLTKDYFLLWEDLRNGFTNWDIYGTALDSLLRPGIEERKVSKPVSLLLHNTPNPFSKSLVIRFQLSVEAKVSLKVYDVSGRLVKILTKAQNFEPGTHTLKWDGRNDNGHLLPSGIYFIRFKTEDYSKTQKVVLFR